jgi:dolichol-phosphate mannosyltransferase
MSISRSKSKNIPKGGRLKLANNQLLKRCIATAAAPFLDAALFCALVFNGLPLQSSHIASFGAAMALNYLLKVRSTIVASGRTSDWRLYCRLSVVSLMAVFLRGGVLALTALHWGWPPEVSIVIAVLAGLAVTIPGYADALSPAKGAARTRALALSLVAYAFALRLAYLGSVELLPEEAYYWNYSRHLDFGYLDHPPMVAWLVRLGTAAFGQSPFGIRIGALCCAGVASVFTYRLTRNLFDEASALAALVLAQALPFFFLSGLLMTPDAPLTAAWAASLYYLERALVAGRPGSWWRAGFALGIGALSKYSIGLLVPVTLVFMSWDRESRYWWRRWQPYAAALVSLAVFSPVILWNAQHEWASFVFQTSRRLAEAPKFALHKLIATVLVLITPTGALAVAAAFTHAPPAAGSGNGGTDTRTGSSADTRPGVGTDFDPGGQASRARLFIQMAILIPVATFVVFSLRHEIKLDWTGAPWTAALPLMGAGMAAAGAASGLRAWVRAAWLPTVIVMLLIYGAGLHYLVLGFPGLGYGGRIELLPVGWQQLGSRIEQIAAQVRGQTGREPLIVGMDRYAVASEIAFYGRGREAAAVETSSAHLFAGIGLMYERWTPPTMQEGRTLLLVALDPGELGGKAVESRCESLGPVEDEVLTKNGHVVRHYYHRLAYNYHSIPRP